MNTRHLVRNLSRRASLFENHSKTPYGTHSQVKLDLKKSLPSGWSTEVLKAIGTGNHSDEGGIALARNQASSTIPEMIRQSTNWIDAVHA